MSESKKRKDVLVALKAQTVDELAKRSVELEEEVFGLQLKHRTGQLKTTSDIRNTKRSLARVNTVLSEKRKQEAR